MKLAITGENFPLWFGGIWLAVGGPMLLLGLYFGWQQASIAEQLQTHGQTASGMVLTKYIARSSSHSDRSSSTPTYWVTVRFSTEAGKVIKGKAQVEVDTWDALIERHPIQVTYLPSAPQTYRIEGETSTWILPFIFAGIGALFTIVGGAVFWSGLRSRRVTERLRHSGMTVEATVTSIGPGSVRINGVKQWVIRYEFTDAAGRKRTGISFPMAPEEAEAWDAGQHGFIRYDPRAPGKSLWIGTAEGRRP
jgi:hypothetical protein